MASLGRLSWGLGKEGQGVSTLWYKSHKSLHTLKMAHYYGNIGFGRLNGLKWPHSLHWAQWAESSLTQQTQAELWRPRASGCSYNRGVVLLRSRQHTCLLHSALGTAESSPWMEWQYLNCHLKGKRTEHSCSLRPAPLDTHTCLHSKRVGNGQVGKMKDYCFNSNIS